MKLLKINDDFKDEQILKWDDLNNDIIFRKYLVKENSKIKLQKDQIGILFMEGKVYDLIEDEGMYLVCDVKNKNGLYEEWNDLIIRNTENEPLEIIIMNRKIIKHNKYFVTEPIEYIEYGKNESKEYYIKFNGNFDFYIENPKVFLSRVIGLRSHFSKQEIIEQIRKFVIESIKIGMEELSKGYKLSLEEVQTKSKELEIKLEKNDADQKLLEYGIRVTYFDIEDLEIVNKKKKFFKK